jgi:ATP-dependent Clp protease ATP-binding subunit ClpA
MFERFTDKAREVVVRSQEAARGLGHGYIGTEHLLLGMLDVGDGNAYRTLTAVGITAAKVREDIGRYMGHDGEALESIGIDLDAVRAKIEENFGPGALDELEPKSRKGFFRRNRPTTGVIPFTARAKKVLELSLREALALRQKHIGTEHILLGVLREGEGLAAKILADAGLDFAQLRQQILAAIAED